MEGTVGSGGCESWSSVAGFEIEIVARQIAAWDLQAIARID